VRTRGRQYRTTRAVATDYYPLATASGSYPMFLIYGVAAFLWVMMLHASAALVGSIATPPSSMC